MIIVTGGAGFIGRNLIARLNTLNQKNILVVDNLEKGEKYINLVNLHISDYVDKNLFLKQIINESSYFKNVEIIFHEGACSSTNEWNGKYIMENNYQYSKELLHYSIRHSIPFIYASSAAVYGNNTSFLYKSHRSENPINIYGYSKFLFDQHVQNILPKVRSQICGLRYFNVYGPYESHKKKMASIIFNLYQQINNHKKPTLFIGSKNFKRDFIYVDNIIDINIWTWLNHISGIYDCGTGIAQSFDHIAQIVLSFLNYNELQYIPMPKQLQNHYQMFTQANTSQLQNIGYPHSFIKIKDGIHQYLSWLSKNHY